jgi:hypothetical protein
MEQVQFVTLEQLARLYEASRQMNSAYDAARRQYKRQQKAKNKGIRDGELNRQIRELMDAMGL